MNLNLSRIQVWGHLFVVVGVFLYFLGWISKR